MYNPQERSLLRYLLEFGAMDEDTLVDYHYNNKDRNSLVTKGFAERNQKTGTYKLTSLGRTKAKSLWPNISKQKSTKKGTPAAIMTSVKNFIQNSLDKKIAPYSSLLGCGGNGCAFKLRDGKVLKLSSDVDEILCATNLYELQTSKKWDTDYPFPIVYEAKIFKDGKSPYLPTYDGLLVATGYYIREPLDDLAIQDIIGGTCRKHAEQFEKEIGRPPKNSYELWKFRTPETDHVFDKIQRDIKRMTGIELYDYKLDENWGKRKLKNGQFQIVYRDLACYPKE